jgi:excisionase family DNA binding protein
MSASSRQNTSAPESESRYRPTPTAAGGGGGRPTSAATGRKAPQWPPTDPTGHPQPHIPTPPPASEPGGQPGPGGPLDQLPQVLKVREAAAILRVGRNQLYQAIARGEVPAVRIGRTIRIPTAALADLLTTSSEPAAPAVASE